MEALVAGGRRRLPSLLEEELLGLLSGFTEDGECGSDRELSFSDLVEAGWATGGPPEADGGAPAPREEGPAPAPAQHEAAASREQRQLEREREQQQAAARERRQRRQRSGGGSRGSCGGGGDGVLLNFYVPGLLTRSMTAPRPGRGVAPPPAAVQGAPAKPAAAAGKGRTQGPLGIGCWPALWGRGRDRRRPAKACT